MRIEEVICARRWERREMNEAASVVISPSGGRAGRAPRRAAAAPKWCELSAWIRSWSFCNCWGVDMMYWLMGVEFRCFIPAVDAMCNLDSLHAS